MTREKIVRAVVPKFRYGESCAGFISALTSRLGSILEMLQDERDSVPQLRQRLPGLERFGADFLDCRLQLFNSVILSHCRYPRFSLLTLTLMMASHVVQASILS
jgi:hypothetical protein